MHKCTALFLALAMTTSLAKADIYRSVDASGHVTFSNIPSPGAVRILVEKPQQRTAEPPISHKPTAETQFPQISPSTQKAMDNTRRKILDNELASEKKALAEAKKAYLAASSIRLGSEHNYQKYLDRVKPFKDAVTIHEQNIAAIEQELDKLRN